MWWAALKKFPTQSTLYTLRVNQKGGGFQKVGCELYIWFASNELFLFSFSLCVNFNLRNKKMSWNQIINTLRRGFFLFVFNLSNQIYPVLFSIYSSKMNAEAHCIVYKGISIVTHQLSEDVYCKTALYKVQSENTETVPRSAAWSCRSKQYLAWVCMLRHHMVNVGTGFTICDNVHAHICNFTQRANIKLCVKLREIGNTDPWNASASLLRFFFFEWYLRFKWSRNRGNLIMHDGSISWTFSRVVVIKHFMGLRFRFPEFDTEFVSNSFRSRLRSRVKSQMLMCTLSQKRILYISQVLRSV